MDQDELKEKLNEGKNIIQKWWLKSNEWLDKLSKQWQFMIMVILGFLSLVIFILTSVLILAVLWFIFVIVWRLSFLIHGNNLTKQ
jgi:hypothetical protein